jgi:superfamily II DNA helicase RecQ
MNESYKTGVKCLRCSKVFWDKSNFNRHHAQFHKGKVYSFETNVIYQMEVAGEAPISEFDWKVNPLLASSASALVADGLLERETKILSRGASFYADVKYAEVGNPPILMRIESEALIDEIDDYVPLCSTLARSQVMRSKNNMLKAIPFQALKDASGPAYALTLSRFFVFAKIYFEDEKLSEVPCLKLFVQMATTEECKAQGYCCMEGFLLCLSQHAPNHKTADALQHSAMHMRRVLRGVALMQMCTEEQAGSGVESFCDAFLNPKRAAPFGILTTLYYEIKRCVNTDRRLLIQRTHPDVGFPPSSAVLVDTGQELKRVTWSMLRVIVNSTIQAIESSLNEMNLPGQNIDLSGIRDVEDPAIGAGILSQNGHLFNDEAQIEWLKVHAASFNSGRHIFQELQKAGQNFLAGICANVGGGSRRMPELCCIAIDVTDHNPIRNFRVFEQQGLLVGDYRKNQGQLLNPNQDLNFWVLPAPAARLLCRLIIFGKPLEVRLAQKFISDEAAVVHRTLIGACNGQPLKSTKLGALTNATLLAHDCPGIQYMRHVREHFSTELVVQHAENIDPNQKSNVIQSHLFEIAAVASNHSAKTSKEVYAGVFEKNSVGGIRKIELQEKLAFSRLFNSAVLGFDLKDDDVMDPADSGFSASSAFLSQETPAGASQSQLSALSTRGLPLKQKSEGGHHLAPTLCSQVSVSKEGGISQREKDQNFFDSSTVDFIKQRLAISELRPLQADALMLLLNAQQTDTKFIQAPTGVGKDLLPFAMAVVTRKAQLIFVPFVPLIQNVVLEGKKFGCKVVKFTDIYKTMSVETAAATADCIVLSYEHAGKAARIAQELAMRQRLGWCFFNEAHVAVLDADFRDFSTLSQVTTHCPQVCCMSATIRRESLPILADKIGRSLFTQSIFVSPERPNLALQLVVTAEIRAFIADNLKKQPQGQRAIIFCLFKSNVTQTVEFLNTLSLDREIFECTSGKADCFAFDTSESGIMVCTTVLAAGVSFKNVTRIYFQDLSHGPEVFLQGSGRGARSEGEQCMAFLVTSMRQLNYFKDSPNAPYATFMANFCMKCFNEGLHFGRELYRLFDHDEDAGAKRPRVSHMFSEKDPASCLLPSTFQVSCMCYVRCGLYHKTLQGELAAIRRQSLVKSLPAAIMASEVSLATPNFEGRCEGM